MLSLVVENSDLDAEVKELKGELLARERETKGWIFQSYAAFALRPMTTQFIRNGISTQTKLIEALEDLLSPLYLQSGDVFGFEASERWSFSVYVYSPQADRLVYVWRQKSLNHPSSSEPRSWGRGQGHVGKAFVDGHAIVTTDATLAEVTQLCQAPIGLRRDYDAATYKSFAALPIGPLGGDESPYGVLVGTSDHEGRFTKSQAELMKHYAESLATLFAITRLKFDELTDEANPKEEDRS